MHATLFLTLLMLQQRPPDFVPFAALQHAGGEATEALAQIAADQPVNPAVPCYQPPELDIAAGSAPVSGERTDVVVIGRVRSVTPGWSTRLRHVMSLVVLEEVVVLRDRGRTLPDHPVITFLDESGSMIIAGKTVCTDPLGVAVHVGDVVAAGGALDAGTPGHLRVSSGFRYLVRDAVVEVRPPFNRSGWRDVPLEEFKNQIRRDP
jgi:hypothetical protein